MTDFIKERESVLIYNGREYYDKLEKVMAQIFNYNNFLSQKLKLWMLVPCKLVNGVWVPIKDTEETMKQGDGNIYIYIILRQMKILKNTNKPKTEYCLKDLK